MPWRGAYEDEEVTLVGFYAEGRAGILTHHGRTTHLHVVLREGALSGHLDEVSLTDGARLLLPRP